MTSLERTLAAAMWRGAGEVGEYPDVEDDENYLAIARAVLADSELVVALRTHSRKGWSYTNEYGTTTLDYPVPDGEPCLVVWRTEATHA